MIRNTAFFTLSLLFTACATTSSSTVEKPPVATATTDAAPPVESANFVFADIPFKPFNPKKPDGVHVFPFLGSPRAGAFSAIIRMPPGLSLPLHAHKSGFSGVVLSDGFVHAASKDKSKVLTKGSTFYQPGGEPHIDACQGDEPCYFLAFFDEAIDMTPSATPAADPKLTINFAENMKWMEVKGGVKMSVIHGNPKKGAFVALIDFPAGMTTNVHTHSAAFSGALISGAHQRGSSADALVTLTPGSVWRESPNAPHMEKCGTESRCVIAAFMNGPLDTKDVEIRPASAE